MWEELCEPKVKQDTVKCKGRVASLQFLKAGCFFLSSPKVTQNINAASFVFALFLAVEAFINGHNSVQ